MKNYIISLQSRNKSVKIYCSNRGFTLFEIICTLILLGIISIFFWSGYINTFKSQIRADSNYQQAQKDQSAIARIMLEIEGATSIAASGNVLSYKFNGESRTISRPDSNLVIHLVDSDKDHILTDSVSSFTTSIDSSGSWRLLKISITTIYSDNSLKTFSTSLYLR
jgi:prepilin-type N-terminal cleavage/methylation domain-containing protein